MRQRRVGSTEYQCRVCHARSRDWSDSCPRCGSWNSIEARFRGGVALFGGARVLDVPVWGVAEDSGEFSLAGLGVPSGPPEK
ncbi:MAG: hypothetical protein R2862_13365 [Thermoanaerobaculia bacterium]